MVVMKLRTLIIDDDAEMIERLQSRLQGMKASSGRRTVKADVDTLLVKVEMVDGRFVFAEETLRALLERCGRRYDYLIVDYAYTSPERQPKQWNEGGLTASRLTSSDHLLTMPQLKERLESFDSAHGGRNARKLKRFFNRGVRVLMRSFQHDRVNDSVGPYSARAEATRGVFPHCTTLDELDGFSMIYGSEPELRERFYQSATGGRRLYRYAASAITVRFYQAALEHQLATKANRFILVRGWLSVSGLVVGVSALSALVQAFASPLVAELSNGRWGSAAILAAVTFVGVLGGSFLVAWIAERGSRRLAEGAEDDWDQ